MEETTVVRPLGEELDFEVPVRHVDWYTRLSYEPLSTQVFRHAAHLSDTVVDIGAHAGWYSSVAARANPRARVVAVEPSPGNHALLERNVARNGLSTIEAINAAFSSAPGEAEVQLTEASDNCGLHGHWNSPTVEVVRVPMIDGSGLEVAPDGALLVKVDVEGAEPDVLAGLEEVMGQASAVRMLVEFNPRCLAKAGYHDPQQLIDWLTERDFAVIAMDDSRFRWRRLESDDRVEQILEGARYVNLYCVRGVESMAVTAVLHSTALAGAERSFLESASALLRRGHLVHAILPDEPPDSPLEARLTAAGIPVSRAPIGWWALPDADGGWVDSCAGLPDVEAELLLTNPRVVVTWTSVIPVGAVAAARLGLPHVWSVHEFVDTDHDLHPPVPIPELGRLVRSLSQEVIVNSAAVAGHLFGGGDAVTIRPPLVPAEPKVSPAALSREPLRSEPILGIFGFVRPAKGYLDVLRAMAVLRARDRSVRLRVHGEGTPQSLAVFTQLAEELGIADLVDLMGFVEDTPTAMHEIDIVVVPSWSEAFGRVPFEAASCGVPVVYAAAGGTAEYMVDGVTGVACVPRDPESLAAAVERVVEDGHLRLALQSGAWTVLSEWLEERRGIDILESVIRRAADSGPCRSEVLQLPMVRQLLLGAAMTTRRRTRAAGEAEEELARLRGSSAECHAALEERDRLLVERELRLREVTEAMTQQLAAVTDSRSWRLTAPLRRLRHQNPFRRT